MAFDVKTIYTLLFLVTVFNASFLLVFKSLIKYNADKLNTYILGKTLQALSLFVVLTLRENSPSMIAMLLSNIPAYFGIALEVYSFASFGNNRFKKKLTTYLLITIAFTLLFALNINNTQNIRVAITFTAFTVFFLFGGIDLISAKPKRKVKRASGIVLLIISIAALLRALDGFISQDMPILFTQRFSEILVFSVYFIITIASTIGFIFLFKEEDEITISENNKQLSSILNGMPDDIYVYNKDRAIIYSNNPEIKKSSKSKNLTYCYENLGFKEKCEWCRIENINDKNRLYEYERYQDKNDIHENIRHILLNNGNIMTIKRDISELRKSQQRIKMLSDIVEQSPDSIIVTNLKGEFEYVNKAFSKTTGYSDKEIIGKKIDFLKSDITNEQTYESIWETIKNSKAWKGELINRKKSGETYYESAVITPTLDENGSILNYFGILKDITQKKTSEKLLQESEKRYHTIFEESADPVMLIKDNLFIDCNKATLDILKLNSKKEFENTLPSDISPKYQPDGKLSEEKQIEMINLAFQNGTHAFEWVHKNSLNENICLDVSLTRIEIKDVYYLYVTWKDITQRKLAEKALLENEQLMNKIFDINPIPVGILDMETLKYIKVNQTDTLGFKPKDLIGKTPIEAKLLTEEQQNHLLDELFKKGKLENIKVNLKKKDKGQVDALLSLYIIEQKGKKLIYTTFIDLTEENKAKKELIQTNKRLKEALEDKEVLLKEVHHRVKNNMQTIHSLLFKQKRLSESNLVKVALQDCMDRVSSMAMINEQIYRNENFKEIDFSKHLSTIIKNLVGTYRNPEKTISLNQEIEPLNLSIDKAIPCSLVVNEIVSNSLKYAFPEQSSGEITLKLKVQDDDAVSLIVSDNGIGLPEDAIGDKISSLGMFIIKNLSIRQLNGDLDIKVKNGTQYILTFNK